jgi:RecA/RadA recombinase
MARRKKETEALLDDVSEVKKPKAKTSKKKVIDDGLAGIIDEMSDFKKDVIDYSNGTALAPVYRIPFKNKALQKITGGVAAGYFLELIGQSQAGKCLAEGTLVSTPYGPMPIEDLKEGDEVMGYNKDGSISPTRVVKVVCSGKKVVYEVRNKHQVMAESTLEHRWGCYSIREGAKSFCEETLDGLDRSSRKRVIRKFVDYKFGEKHEPHAYAIGALLGDGCSRQGVSNIHISSPNCDVPLKVQSVLNAKNCYKQSEGNNTYVISNSRGKGLNQDTLVCNMFNEHLRGKYSHEKNFPLHLIADWDRESILNLIAGLIDTDGSVTNTDNKYLRLSYSSTSLGLHETFSDLIYLVFQVKPTVCIDSREGRRDCYNANISDNFNVTRILRTLGDRIVSKSKRYKPEYENLKTSSRPDCVGVKTGSHRISDVWDIQVDNETHLYVLHDNGLVTHNSFLIYELMAECEKMGGYCLLADLERALEDSYWGIVGLTPKKSIITYQNRIEKLFPLFVKFVETVRKKDKHCPIVIAVDSYPVLKTDAEQNEFESGDENKKKGFADMRRATEFYSRMETFLQIIDDQNVVFVVANQMRINYRIMFGDKRTSRGNEVLQYWAHMRIRGELKQKHKMKVATLEKEKLVQVGVDTEWTTIKNRGVTPFKTAKTSILYRTGVNPWSGLEEVLLNSGQIEIVSRPAKIPKPKKETLDEKIERERLSKIFTFKVKGDESGEVFECAKDICTKYPHLLEPIWTGQDDVEGEIISEEVSDADAEGLTEDDLE